MVTKENQPSTELGWPCRGSRSPLLSEHLLCTRRDDGDIVHPSSPPKKLRPPRRPGHGAMLLTVDKGNLSKGLERWESKHCVDAERRETALWAGRPGRSWGKAGVQGCPGGTVFSDRSGKDHVSDSRRERKGTTAGAWGRQTRPLGGKLILGISRDQALPQLLNPLTRALFGG